MKKQVLVTLAALLALAGLLTAFAFAASDAAELGAAGNVYAILYEDGELVFQYGAAPKSGGAVKATYPLDLTEAYKTDYDEEKQEVVCTTPWYGERESVLVADFADKISPVSTAYWFDDCYNLERVDNVGNLDAANVTDMQSMFSRCRRLAELDLSSFDTANVTNMSYMFSDCDKLTTLNVSRFNTANVTNMGHMFAYCESLTELDLSSFDTANVTMMYQMFYACFELTELDLSSFDTAKVEQSYQMFGYCDNLRTIFASEKFTTASIIESGWDGSIDMFASCAALVGGAGTTYDKDHINKEYARIDKAGAPGYFTYKPAPVKYAITDAVKKDGELSVTLTNVGAATLAVSQFDASGKFIAAQLQDVPADAGTVALTLSAGAQTARVMLLDGALCPLCAARTA